MSLSNAELDVLRSLDDVWQTAAELRVRDPDPIRLTATLRRLRRQGLCSYRRTPGGDGRPRGEWAITPTGDTVLSR